MIFGSFEVARKLRPRRGLSTGRFASVIMLVTPDVRVPQRLQDAEEQVMVCVAELRAHAEELAKRERRHCPQRRVLSKIIWLVLSGEMLEIYEP
jgi:hypothetical protein